MIKNQRGKMLNIWLSNMDSALSHLSEYGISNTLFSSSKLGDDISQIACALEMLPVAAEWDGKHDNLWKFKEHTR